MKTSSITMGVVLLPKIYLDSILPLSVSMGLGGLFKGCWRWRTGWGMFSLSLDMDREGPAPDPNEPGCGESTL